jgi:uncharacterized membrane protein
MNELMTYLNTLENRIIALENENKLLHERLATGHVDNLTLREEIKKHIPSSELFSSSFWKRAFAVWGHYFVAQLIISAMLFVFYLIILVIFMVAGISLGGS